MNISKRLIEIGNMVDTKFAYDVGCDHALLDIYLSKKQIYCLGIDISENCIEKAKKTIKDNKYIELLVNNGLNNIKIKKNSTVIISGMGTKTILKIINQKNIDNLICQSNKNIYELRKKICNFGYYIADEKIIYDKKYYIIIKFRKGISNYSDKELLLGPVLLKNKDEIFIDYLKYFKKIIDENNFENKYKKIIQIINEEL